MKTKIGTEVAHVTRYMDITFKVKRSRSHGHIVMAFCTSCFSFAAATASAGVALENVAAYINNTALQLQKK